ncbi:probable glycerol-3-phosphate acyltransferase 3 [Typha angustifolia]|uniref:probable glycerol-3-phosphate acyltransferase 3 n=1 Tax=Typha angustifolia TaxID=59011 RepID=UPI003C2BCC78
MASKAFSKSFLSFYRFLRRRLGNRRSNTPVSHANLQKWPPSLDRLSSQTVVLDVEGGLLRSSSTFPYFMLVALEAGGFLRGLLLLLLYPLLCCFSQELALKVMVMVCFIGIKESNFRLGRAVLPKFFLEDVGLEGYQALKRGGRKVCLSGLPRIMVEGFLKEYLGVEVVVGRELKVVRGYYSGFLEKMEVEESLGLKAMVGQDEKEELGGGVVGFGSCSKSSQHHLFSLCQEVHLVSESEKSNWQVLPREEYRKALVFHDGRLAFRPTPLATLGMFIWLPFGLPLTIFRSVVFLLLPYRISIPIVTFTGLKNRLIFPSNSTTGPSTTYGQSNRSHSHLYVCNHRTLLDPIYISAALNKHVTAVTYSVSRISEVLSPIRTVRLTRNKEEDRRRMEKLLSQGDLVVCPEGTTCREPYLLRFSPLFAELTDEIVPVALVTRVNMFYGTSTSGLKFLDPFYFLMNPCPQYDVQFLEKIPTSSINGKSCSNYEVANHVQSEIGRALGFEPTTLTRKDKYLMLAGNEGVVKTKSKRH